ncbi:hypothetical protein [Natronomonas marina]|jgi:hypothetical protein|uniref:hypothetical protein n=1 Tax=Natronomonas marina TaxID=2961939 RepID=UPI0020C99A19|nr:hypothetical protein [Natronomonas marina]
MQRRWAAVCIAFFVVMAASAYSVMALAEAPTVDVEGEQYGDGDTLQANGTTYTVTVSEGAGDLATNRTVENEETFANNTAIDYRNGSYNVSIEPGNDSESFTLVEEFDVTAVLEADSEVENSTFTRDDGTEVVVYRNGTTRPLEEYLDPERVTFSEGDTIEHDNTTKTVANVTSSEVLVTWEGQEQTTVGLSEGKVFALGDTEYVATFPDNSTVVLSTDVEGYDTYENNVEYYQERTSGLMYVIIFSASSVFLIAALAFLPHRG